MRVAVVHNTIIAGESDPSTLDVMEEARIVCGALADLGHAAELFPFDRDIAAVLREMRLFRPDRIFNLVESVEGLALLHPSAAALWELMGIPHTGSSAHSITLVTHKPVAKSILAFHGIDTPEWAACAWGDDSWRSVPGPWILKPAIEDASIGIEEDSVVRDGSLLSERLPAMQKLFPGQAILVERFIDGREFNVALLASSSGPEVLPTAEILFQDFPLGKERIVGYRAKWDPAAFEYAHTPRTFEFPPTDAPLIGRLREIALRCWRIFGLNGYARVDFRIGADLRPYVLEVNDNPCISPDAGFAASVERAGITPMQMAQRILEDSVWFPT